MSRVRDVSGRVLAAARILPARVRLHLAPFLAGMERRMARDLERVHLYHTGLWSEADRRRRNFGSTGSTGAAAGEELRLAAIEREYRTKVADLERRYAITVDLRLEQALRVALPVRRAAVAVLRRQGRREVELDWNPLARRLDARPCEGCGSLPPAYRICDDALHWLCAGCMAPCPSCGRNCCRACTPRGCARCR